MSDEILTVATFDSLQEAYFAKSLLESLGLEMFLTNENAMRTLVHPHLSGGIGLLIAKDDLDVAREVLATIDSGRGRVSNREDPGDFK